MPGESVVLDTVWNWFVAQEPVLRFLVTGFALILLLIAILAYRRTRHPRIGYIGLAYAAFFVNGLLLIWGLVAPAVEERLLFVTTIFEFVVLFLLYMAVLKRMKG